MAGGEGGRPGTESGHAGAQSGSRGGGLGLGSRGNGRREAAAGPATRGRPTPPFAALSSRPRSSLPRRPLSLPGTLATGGAGDRTPARARRTHAGSEGSRETAARPLVR